MEDVEIYPWPEVIRKLFLSENFETFVWQETGSEIAAGIAVAMLRMISGSVTQPGGVYQNLQPEIIFELPRS